MSSTNIDLEKSELLNTPIVNVKYNDELQNMELSMRVFFKYLNKPNKEFKPSDAFDELLKYVNNYDRILYSTISNIVYTQYNSGNITTDSVGVMLSNLDDLICFVKDENNIVSKKRPFKDQKIIQNIDDIQIVVFKIWDHVTLAIQQYTMLKQTDAEYDEKFKKRIMSYKDEMSKETSTQMITMVGIFTALAFLVFGSISSLDGVFENINFPLFKVISIGLIWGLCVSNMIFVFLYCIEKMTKLSFKANYSAELNVFQQYPIVWWTNLILVSLLSLSLWAWFAQSSDIVSEFIKITNSSPWIIFGIGTACLVALIVFSVMILIKHTYSPKNKN